MSQRTTEAHTDDRPVGTLFGVVIDPQSYRNLAYLVLAFPLGLAYFVALTVGLAVGAGLAVLLVGIPILLAVVLGSRVLAAFERTLANALLEVDILRPMDVRSSQDVGFWPALKSYLAAGSTWRGLAFCYLKFWLGIVAFVLVVTLVAVSLSLLSAPLHYDVPTVGPVVFGWEIDTLGEAVLAVPIGAALAVASLHVLNAVARAFGLIARALLGDPVRQPAGSAVVERASGDRRPASDRPTDERDASTAHGRPSEQSVERGGNADGSRTHSTKTEPGGDGAANGQGESLERYHADESRSTEENRSDDEGRSDDRTGIR